MPSENAMRRAGLVFDGEPQEKTITPEEKAQFNAWACEHFGIDPNHSELEDKIGEAVFNLFFEHNDVRFAPPIQ